MNLAIYKILSRRVETNFETAEGLRKQFFDALDCGSRRPDVKDINEAYTRWEESRDILAEVTRSASDAIKSDER
jgi:hypothetical protein